MDITQTYKHEPIHEKCKGCHQIVAYCEIDDWVEAWYGVCAIYPNPNWIWENRYCPEKTRHEGFLLFKAKNTEGKEE